MTRNKPMKPQRNLWPLGIIFAFVIFMSGTATLIVLACSHRTDLVSADYYEQEIRYQGQMDRMDRTKQLNEKVSVTYDAGRKQIAVSLPPEHVRQSATGSIQLYRPSAAGLDQWMKLEIDSNGVQTIDAAGLRAGLWKVKVLWRVGREEYFIDEKVDVKS
jgi:nitrogen fixation protein FixH